MKIDRIFPPERFAVPFAHCNALNNFAVLLPVLKETYESAVPVLVQEDRYLHTTVDNTNIDAFAYLLGAFKYGETVVPVQFELKHFRDGQDSRIYVVATIKEAISFPVQKPINAATRTAGMASEINLVDVINNVNINDGQILANLPYPMLPVPESAEASFLNNPCLETVANTSAEQLPCAAFHPYKHWPVSAGFQHCGFLPSRLHRNATPLAFSCLAYQNGAKNVVAPVSVSILGAVLLIEGIISAVDGSEDSVKLIMGSLALTIGGCIWYFVYKSNERNGVYEQEKIAELMQIEKEKDQALESQNQSAP